MSQKPDPVACPQCGNTTEQEGISYAYLEWRTMPVWGTENGKLRINYCESESAEIDEQNPVLAVQNIPVVTEDAEHLHCNNCGWNWYDPRPKD